MFLAACLVQPYPAPPALAEVIAYPHLQYCADAGEGIHHHANQRPIAQAGQRVRINGGKKRSCFLVVEHRRLAILL